MYKISSNNNDKWLMRIGYFCFFFSGVAALIYEILWVRLLGQVFGNTTFAISTVLAAYMAGLGIGGYFIGRFSDRIKSPLRAYGILELLIGIYAAFTFLFVGGIKVAYIAFAQKFDPGNTMFTLIRLLLSLPVLFIPTFLMGATMPVLAKIYIRSTAAVGSGAALLYGLNTAGAVVGTLAAGFYFLPQVGMKETLIITVALNIFVGIVACVAAAILKTVPDEANAETPLLTQTSPEVVSSASETALIPRALWVPFGLFLTGAIAMFLEIAWTRVLASVLGSSTYAFTIMLATFLLGLSIGSALFKFLLTNRRAYPAYFAGLTLYIAFSSMITLPWFQWMDFVALRMFAMTIGYPEWFNFMRFIACSLLIVLPTLGFGALFPVSVALYTNDYRNVGRDLGSLYLANTMGNICGSLLTGFVLIPTIGIYNTLFYAITASGVLGVLVLFLDSTSLIKRFSLAVPAALLLLLGLGRIQGGWDHRLITHGLHILPYQWVGMTNNETLAGNSDRQIIFYREGLNSIVNVTQVGEHRNLKVNAKADASTIIDLHTQIFSGTLPHLLHPDPKQSLIIGFGSGTTLAASLAFPIDSVDLIEIEPAVLEAAPFFDRINRMAYKDPRAHLHVNDGRNHLLITPKNYDLIISEPSNPWMAGTANLFSVDFYALVKKRLNPKGILCQWVQSYSMAPADFKMVLASVSHVFPHAMLWNCLGGDWLIIAANDPVTVDLPHIDTLYQSLPLLRDDLKVLNIRGAAGILSYFVMTDKDMKRFVEGATLNTDNLLLLEFNAPNNLHSKDTAQLIYKLVTNQRTETLPPLITAGLKVDEVPRWLVQMGEGLIGKNQNQASQEAVNYFQKALSLIALGEDHAAAYTGIGKCLILSNQMEKAIQHLSQAIIKNPESAEAYAYLGVAQQKTGNANKAYQALKKATELDPANHEYFFWLGQILEAGKKYSEAVAAYESSHSLNPYPINPRINQGRCLRLNGQLKESAQSLEKLRQEFISYYSIYQELKSTYEALGTLDKAVPAYEELCRYNPYKKQYWFDLILLYDQTQADSAKLSWAIEQGSRTAPFFQEELLLLRKNSPETPAQDIATGISVDPSPTGGNSKATQ